MKKQLLAASVCTAFITACGGSNSDSPSEQSTQSESDIVFVLGDGESDNGSSPESESELESGSEEAVVEVAADNETVVTGVDSTQDNSPVTNTDTNTASENGSSENNGVVVDENDDQDASGSDQQENEQPVVDIVDNIRAPSGLLDTAQPTFVWPAVANAEQYKIVVKDAGNSGYARTLDPMAANCQTGEGMCSASTSLAYYDNHMTWYVESTVDGAPGPVSDSYSITTPLSENLQAILSNDTGCEGWASVQYGKYIVLNNTWNSRSMNTQDWSQSINVTENADGSISPAWAYDWRGQFDGDEIEVKSYPEVLYGPKLGTHVSGTKEETGLPALVSELPEFVVNYDYSETGNAERNVAIESFFHDSDDIRGPCDTDDNRVYEMMIWVNNPSIRTPGKLALTGIMIDNQLWNVYIKPDSNKHYIAFTAQNPTTSGTLNWKRFVEWTSNWTAINAEAERIDVLNPGFHMGAIEIGTETWWGEGTFTLNKFEVTF